MELKKLYKKATNGNTQEWQIFVEGDKFWTVHGKLGGKLITGKPTICTPKNVGRSNATTGEEQAILEAQAKWTKRTENHYREDIADIDDEEQTFFKVTLAKSYDKRKPKVEFPALYNHKLDGIRYVARADVGHSRNGKPLGGLFAVKDALKPFFEAYPDAILDGEAFNVDFNDKFEDLVSLIKRDEAKLTQEMKVEITAFVQYHVYDVARIDGLTENDSYLARFNRFWEIIENEFPEIKQFVKKVDNIVVNSHDEIDVAYQKSIELGYEGGILRYDKPYECKRTWNLLKIKTFMDEEFEILAINEGVGNKIGVAGSMTLKHPDGRTFNSNIKGGFKLYKRIWDDRDTLVGSTATCKFFEYTSDGIPRFPYIIKIAREDYE